MIEILQDGPYMTYANGFLKITNSKRSRALNDCPMRIQSPSSRRHCIWALRAMLTLLDSFEARPKLGQCTHSQHALSSHRPL